jgi:hypothetical protein
MRLVDAFGGSPTEQRIQYHPIRESYRLRACAGPHCDIFTTGANDQKRIRDRIFLEIYPPVGQARCAVSVLFWL